MSAFKNSKKMSYAVLWGEDTCGQLGMRGLQGARSPTILRDMAVGSTSVKAVAGETAEGGRGRQSVRDSKAERQRDRERKIDRDGRETERQRQRVGKTKEEILAVYKRKRARLRRPSRLASRQKRCHLSRGCPQPQTTDGGTAFLRLRYSFGRLHRAGDRQRATVHVRWRGARQVGAGAHEQCPLASAGACAVAGEHPSSVDGSEPHGLPDHRGQGVCVGRGHLGA